LEDLKMSARTFKYAAFAVFVVFALLMYGTVKAAPTLTADPVPATGAQPTGAEWQVQGAATWLPCTLAGSPKVMACDLVSLTATVGPATLLARYTYAAGCDATGACWGAGAAVSTPFAFRWLGVGASAPAVLRVAP
jgi:hypothetical protein